MDAQQLWKTAQEQLQIQLPKSSYETWIQNTRGLSYEDGVLVIGVHSAYAKDWLENRLYGTIQKTLSEIAHRTTTVRFVVHRNNTADWSEVDKADSGILSTFATETNPTIDRETSQVNPRYTFENFIVGQSNRLAHAGCLAVSENPGMAYNPLFIYGGVGLGKTHLLHAIGNRTLRDNRRTLYVSTETFANEMINAIRSRTTEEFRAKYRSIEVLLLDDIHFLINKEATQEEFFHTFNDLYQRNRQIVISSDRPPKAFVGLEERLRSRFEWGLTADIQPPDLETRIAILSIKAESHGLCLAPELLEFIAQQVQSNIRELEGALTRVLAFAKMLGEPLTIQTAQRALGEIANPLREIAPDDIIAQVAEYYGVAVEDLLGPARHREIALARQVAMYLIREMTSLSLPQIGSILGNRDHTTVLYGIEKISALFEKDNTLRRQILAIKGMLSGNGQSQSVPRATGLRYA